MTPSWWLLIVAALQLAAAQVDERYIVTQERTRPSLRARFTPLSPAELLQRVTAARAAFTTPAPDSHENEFPSDKKTEIEVEINPTTSRSYRKQYSGGNTGGNRRTPQQNHAAELKELLKQSGTMSLSEILQQKNLSLSDLLQSKKLARTVLSDAASTTSRPVTSTTESLRTEYVAERYHTTKRPGRDPSLYNTNQRSSYLHSKRVKATPPSVYHEVAQQRWPTQPVQEEDDKKADSREDILELLQPGSPVSLASILSSRNMTLAELMEHRERGSRQQQLADLFSDLLLGKVATQEPADLVARASSRHVSVLQTVTSKPRGSRDPRLLDMPHRNSYALHDYEAEVSPQSDVTTRRMGPDVLEYEMEDEEDDEGSVMPVAVKSAILASGGLLAITMILFAAIFLCCKIQQRRRRGANMPFLRNSKLARSERNVVIKPAGTKTRDNFVDF